MTRSSLDPQLRDLDALQAGQAPDLELKRLDCVAVHIAGYLDALALTPLPLAHLGTVVPTKSGAWNR